MKNLYLVHLVSKDLKAVFQDRSRFVVSGSPEIAEDYFKENGPHSSEELEEYEIFVHDVTANYLRDDLGGLEYLLKVMGQEDTDAFVEEVKDATKPSHFRLSPLYARALV